MSYVLVCVSFSPGVGVMQLFAIISTYCLLFPGLTKAAVKVWGIQSPRQSSTLLIMALIGQEMPGLWGYQVLLSGTEMSVCSDPPPWINIQQGLSHFAHLFVD